MSTSLSSLVDNLPAIYKKECKGCEERRKIKSVCNFIGLKNNKLNYESKECKTRWLLPINGLIKKFPNLYQFCNGDINKFVLLLRKGVYPYEYMDSWKRFDETSLPDKKAFYIELYVEEITDKDYTHAQKVFEEFKLKKKVIIMTCMFKVIHFCLQMCLKTLETSALKYMNLIMLVFCLRLD